MNDYDYPEYDEPLASDDDFDDAAYERAQQRAEQRYLENDANWD